MPKMFFPPMELGLRIPIHFEAPGVVTRPDVLYGYGSGVGFLEKFISDFFSFDLKFVSFSGLPIRADSSYVCSVREAKVDPPDDVRPFEAGPAMFAPVGLAGPFSMAFRAFFSQGHLFASLGIFLGKVAPRCQNLSGVIRSDYQDAE